MTTHPSEEQLNDPEGHELVNAIHGRQAQRRELGRLILGRTATSAVEAILAAGYRKDRQNNTTAVLADVALERERQTAKWGEQNHPDGTGPARLPMPYNSGSWSALHAAEQLKLATQIAAQSGFCTWLHILREEVFEAFAETDPVKLRAELVQVAAVAVQWVEVIDRRNGATK